MTSRILPPEEWDRLTGTELETIWPVLPMGSQIVVVEDGDQIVGCWALYPQIHVEGVWIAESHRGRASVLRRLIVGMTSTAQSMGARSVNTAALDETVVEMLQRLGAVEVHGRHFSLPVGG